MNQVRIALKNKLAEDAQLKVLAAGGIYFKLRKEGAAPPYVIFSKASGVPTWAFDGPSMDRDVWLVKGVGKRADAEAIDKRIREVLDHATLNIEGKSHQDIRRIADVDYDEIADGERIDHVGAEYRISSEDK